MNQATIGVIGGSGLYEIEGMTDVSEVEVDTPFGAPSASFTVGELGGVRIAFLPRHGKGHRFSPTDLPVRANIFGFKKLGVQHLISVSAVGSLREEIEPLDLVIPDQLIDRTKNRENTFFGNGLVVHAGFADPFCAGLSELLHRAASASSATVHRGGSLVVMEGPLFSSRAESELYRSWGASLIGMTALPEAKLAREAEICYGTIACVTDYDCWHDGHESVTVEMVISNLAKNVETAKKIVKSVVGRIGAERACSCKNALQSAIITAPHLVPEQVKRDLAPLIGKYLS